MICPRVRTDIVVKSRKRRQAPAGQQSHLIARPQNFELCASRIARDHITIEINRTPSTGVASRERKLVVQREDSREEIGEIGHHNSVVDMGDIGIKYANVPTSG